MAPLVLMLVDLNLETAGVCASFDLCAFLHVLPALRLRRTCAHVLVSCVMGADLCLPWVLGLDVGPDLDVAEFS